MTSVRLTLPLFPGTSPFELSAREAAFNGDRWAWLFLRLNPRYRHDFELLSDHETRRGGAREGQLIADRDGTIAGELLQMDSRTFSINKLPIDGSAYLDVKYQHASLETAILTKHLDPKNIRWREFEAATDYGIGAWIDPEQTTLPILAEAESWFYLGLEPIWRTRSPAFRSGAAKTRIAEEGPAIVVGQEAPAMWTDFELEASDSTELDFLICLDGHVEAQLQRVRALVNAVHRQAAPPLRRGRVGRDMPAVIDAHQAAEAGRSSLIERVTRVPSIQGVHWRHVVVDFAAPLEEQFSLLKQELERQKGEIPELMARRMRAGRRSTVDGHWLKKALVAVEYLLGYVDAGQSKTDALAALVSAAFGSEERGGADPYGRLEEAMKVGRAFVRGDYRFLVDYCDNPEAKT